MTIFKHELRQGRVSLAVWTLCVGLLMAACVLLFPQMRGEMDAVGEMFASMGGFTAAFGMDRLNIGTLTGFYAVECGNLLGLGGTLYAALSGIAMLSKEERGGTAEFLLAHPLSRSRVVAEKLAALLAQILTLNAAILALCLICVAAIGEAIPWRELLPLHLAHLLMQIELAGICLGISALLRRGGAGLGLGLAAGLYALNLLANLTKRAAFLKWLTPFAYCEGADILTSGSLNAAQVAVGMLACAAGIALAFAVYRSKDVR